MSRRRRREREETARRGWISPSRRLFAPRWAAGLSTFGGRLPYPVVSSRLLSSRSHMSSRDVGAWVRMSCDGWSSGEGRDVLD